MNTIQHTLELETYTHEIGSLNFCLYDGYIIYQLAFLHFHLMLRNLSSTFAMQNISLVHCSVCLQPCF